MRIVGLQGACRCEGFFGDFCSGELAVKAACRGARSGGGLYPRRCFFCYWINGAACRVRTSDPIITNDVLYRLS